MSDKTSNPCANPSGINNIFLSFGLNIAPTHLPKVCEPILKSTATEYYTIEKWVDNDTISCNKYTPQNGELGSIVEKKDIKIS